MTMPGKKSRSVEVRGKQYRWMVKRTSGVGLPPTIRLTVEDQSTMDIFQKDFPPTDDGEGTPSVTPSDVREFIRSFASPCQK